MTDTPHDPHDADRPDPAPAPPAPVAPPSDHARALAALKAALHEMRTVIRGQDEVLVQMLVTLLCGGHALLEGVPGTAKTLMVRVLSRALSCETTRIQFTPDLMPSDITGTSVYDLASNQFNLQRGPVFTDLLLADEINRAPAKTQAALLEAMAEAQVTIDGTTHPLSRVFTVYATQNPVEYEGTYPLPEAQLDRFLMKIEVGYPSVEAEAQILEAIDAGTPLDRQALAAVKPALTMEGVLAARQTLAKVRTEPGVRDYVLKLARATREHDSVLVGAGPRGAMALLVTAKGRALVHGRDYVTPDDVVAMVGPVLGHRLTLQADAEIGGLTSRELLDSVIDATEVPR